MSCDSSDSWDGSGFDALAAGWDGSYSYDASVSGWDKDHSGPPPIATYWEDQSWTENNQNNPNNPNSKVTDSDNTAIQPASPEYENMFCNEKISDFVYNVRQNITTLEEKIGMYTKLHIVKDDLESLKRILNSIESVTDDY